MALIAAYSFDETGSTCSDSAGDNDFALTSGAARVTGKHNGGLSPSGTMSPVLPDIGKTDLRTVMCWAKGSMPDEFLIIWNVASLDSAAWGIGCIGGNIRIQGRNAGTEAYAQDEWETTVWHHVAGTYDGSTIRLYVDGALVDSAALAGPLRTDSDPPTLFGWDSSGGVIVDDLRIYDSVLDPTAIAVAMGSGVAVSDYAAAAALSVDADFVARITAAVEQHAVTVGLEVLALTDVSPADKARMILAQNALANPTGYGSRFAWAVACDSTVDATVDDATIATKVSNVWNLIANVPI